MYSKTRSFNANMDRVKSQCLNEFNLTKHAKKDICLPSIYLRFLKKVLYLMPQ